MNAGGGVEEAFSQAELIEITNRYLADPSIDRAGRAEIVRLELGELDGQAARRTADYLLRFAGAKQ